MIHLGYEIDTGNPVEVPEGHTVFLGQTSMAGKTTAAVGMAVRSGYATVAYETKIQEGGFKLVPKGRLHPTPPYYQEGGSPPDRTFDWHSIRDLCEAVYERPWGPMQETIIRSFCRRGNFGRPDSKLYATWPMPKTMRDVLCNMDIALKKASGNRQWMLQNLADDLAEALDEIRKLKKKSRVPELKIGINVVNLVREPEYLQSLIVASMIKWVRQNRERTIIMLPEAWKFTDAIRRTAVGQAARHYIREGAAARNFLWIDSQTIGRLSGELLSQCRVWLFGVQKWSRELGHALDAMPDHYWPQRSDIQTLGKGEFLVCWDRWMVRTYVQPAWMNSLHAQAIARRDVEIESAEGIKREFERSVNL